MWVRAVWLEGDIEEEGVIPEVWIQGNNVRWPNGINVIRARTEQRIPLNKWHSYPLLKVKFKSEDMQLCENYDFTTTAEMSDGDHDEVPRQKNSRRPRNQLQSSESEHEDNLFSKEDFPMPPMTLEETDNHLPITSSPVSFSTCAQGISRRPKAVSKSKNFGSSREKSVANFPTSRATLEEISNRLPVNSVGVQEKNRRPMKVVSNSRSLGRYTPEKSVSRLTERARLPSDERRSPPKKKKKRNSLQGELRRIAQSASEFSRSVEDGDGLLSDIDIGRLEAPLAAVGDHLLTKSRSDQRDNTANGFPMPEAKFQKRVLHLLTEIRNTLQQVGKKYEPVESDFQIEKLTESSQLAELEDSLTTEESRKLMLSRISKIGGTCLKSCVHNMMFRLMNNEAMSGMNMNGTGDKIGFGKTTTFQLITEAALKSHGGTEKEVATICSRLLKYAPDRTGGGGRKKKSA